MEPVEQDIYRVTAINEDDDGRKTTLRRVSWVKYEPDPNNPDSDDELADRNGEYEPCAVGEKEGWWSYGDDILTLSNLNPTLRVGDQVSVVIDLVKCGEHLPAEYAEQD